ncbi:hypothetical protein, partial [Nocardia sp. NPDC004722]
NMRTHGGVVLLDPVVIDENAGRSDNSTMGAPDGPAYEPGGAGRRAGRPDPRWANDKRGGQSIRCVATNQPCIERQINRHVCGKSTNTGAADQPAMQRQINHVPMEKWL